MINENILAKGVVTAVLTGPDGHQIVQEANTVVNVGLAFIASRMKDTTMAVASHIGVGTGTDPVTAAQTGLIGETARAALTSTTLVTTNVTNDSIQYVTTFAPGIASVGITEAGLFNASSGPSMIARVKFDVINKGVLDTLTLTWKITIA